MPKWNCSYAYNIPCYCDFVVEAESEEAAEKIIEQALADGKFSHVTCEPQFGDTDDERVFVSGEVSDEDAIGRDTLEELVESKAGCK